MSTVDQHPFKPQADNPRRCTCGKPESAAVHHGGGVVRVTGQ